MKLFDKFKKLSVSEFVFILVILIIGGAYTRYSWVQLRNQQSENVLQICRSIETLLPKEDLQQLEAKPEDISSPHYLVIKTALKAIIKVNNKARFAYILKERNGKLYFYADSESEQSTDISPPGQEFTEADDEDYQPFRDGKELITSSLTDRWGTWKTVYIPIKNSQGKVLAVFGMDFDSRLWAIALIIDVIKSSLLMLVLLLALLFSFGLRRRNLKLKFEVAHREKVEEDLHESENQKTAILKAIPDILFIFNQEGDFLDVYSESDLKPRINKEDTIGKNIRDLFPDDIVVKAMSAFKKSIDNKSVEKFSYFINIDGRLEFFEARIVPTTDNKLLAIVRDITELRVAEEELRKQTDELRRFNTYFVDREHKMIELKKEINELLKKHGGDAKYEIFE